MMIGSHLDTAQYVVRPDSLILENNIYFFQKN